MIGSSSINSNRDINRFDEIRGGIAVEWDDFSVKESKLTG